MRDAVDMISITLGGAAKFRSAFQSEVKVSRWGTIPNSPAFAPPNGISTVVGDIVLPDYHFNASEAYATYGVIHEIGHVWDFRSGGKLSKGMQESLGTKRCHTNRSGVAVCSFDIKSGKEPPPGDPDVNSVYAGTSAWEDWAEAFATYVYPACYGSNPANNPLGPIRRQYVLDQISAIR